MRLIATVLAALGIAAAAAQCVALFAAGSLRAPLTDVARAFADYVLSPDGQAVLARHGFAPP